MKRVVDYEALASFDAIAVHGGLGGAYRATGRSKATLSRHLAELERQLGVRLAERGDHGVRLTEEGARLHERAHGLLLELADAASAIAGGAGAPHGLLRVSAPVVLSHVALTPIVAAFCRDHPGVEVDLVVEDRTVDPVEDGFDVVLRVDPKPEERLIGRRLGHDRRLVVAAPGVAMHPDAAELAVPGIALSSATAAEWRIRDVQDRLRIVRPEVRLRMSSMLMVRDAAVAGAGAALIPGLLAAPEVAAGRLTCWGAQDGPPVEIWALHPSRRLTSAKVRAFLAALSVFPAAEGQGGSGG